MTFKAGDKVFCKHHSSPRLTGDVLGLLGDKVVVVWPLQYKLVPNGMGVVRYFAEDLELADNGIQRAIKCLNSK